MHTYTHANTHTHIYTINLSLFGYHVLSSYYILLYLTPSRIKQLDLDYLVSYSNLEEIWINGLSMEKIYENKIDNKTIIEGKEVSGIYIYKFVK